MSTDLIASERKLFRYEWIWVKSRGAGFLNANKMPLRIHENILVFYKKCPPYSPQFTAGRPYKRTTHTYSTLYDCQKPHTTVNPTGGRYPTDVLYFPKTKESSHPTEKPVALLEYLIKTYTREGETVCDCFMGCGSTGVACVRTNRNFIGVEMQENFFIEAKQRIETAEFLNEPKQDT